MYLVLGENKSYFMRKKTHSDCNKFSETNTSGTGTAYPSGAPEFIPGFPGVHVT